MLPDQQRLADAEQAANSAVSTYISDSASAAAARDNATSLTATEEASRGAAATAIAALDAVVEEFKAALGPVPTPGPTPPVE